MIGLRLWLRAPVAALWLAALGCGPGDADDKAPAAACPAGQLAGPAGGCMAVGIQGCAAAFLGPDGTCRPSLDACPKGTIPKFDSGCVAVGVVGCAAPFVAADGTCRASRDLCPAGSFALPLEGCVPIDGAGCGTGTWGNVADGPSTVWVDPAFAGVSDGSRDHPVTTLAAALAMVPSGWRVVLAAGDYAEPAVLAAPVQIVGRCASLVKIHGTTGKLGLDAVAAVSAAGVTLRSLTLGGAGIGVYVVGGSAKLVGVHLDGATVAGAAVAGKGASLTLDHCLVENTASDGQGEYGQALEVMQGARAEVVSSALVKNRRMGIGASDAGTRLIVDKSVIEHTASEAKSKITGRGIEAIGGAAVVVSSSALIANRDIAVLASDAGTTVELSHAVVAATQPQESDQLAGRGLQAQNGAHVTASACAVVENRDVGAYATDTGSRLELDGTLVADTAPVAVALTSGDGVAIERGAAGTVTGSAVVRNHTNGIVAGAYGEVGATVDVAGTLIADTQVRAADGKFGRGVNVRYESTGTVQGCAITGNHQVGIGLHYTSSLTVDATLVAGTQPIADGSYGLGLAADHALKLAVTGALLRDNRGAGVLVTETADDTTVTAAGAISVERTVIDGVSPGRFYQLSGNTIDTTYDGISDGLVVFASYPTVLKNVVIGGCGRAGLVFDGTPGTLSAVKSAAGQFGLVAQKNPKPDWSSTSNAFLGGVQAVLTDGALPVPGAPPMPGK